MKFNQLASHIAKIEGKKRQVTIGNIRETLSIIAELFAKEDSFPEEIKTHRELTRIGKRKLARKKRK